MSFPVDSFEALMALEPHGPDTYIGVGPDYPWGRVYGGQVVAQALRAAATTVPETHRVHSLHAYFIRGGDSDEPIRYEVDRIRNGRAFITRRVVARQSGGAIFNMSSSFQIDEAEAEVDAEPFDPETPGPEGIDNNSWGPLLDRRELPHERGRARTWLRVPGAAGGDPVLDVCAIAYASDDAPMEAAFVLHPSTTGTEEDYERYMSATLDHAIWFQRPVTGDGWYLYDQRCDALGGGRGLSMGKIYGREGRLVAQVAQEVVLRALR